MSRASFASRLGAWAFVRLQRWLERRSAKTAERIGIRLGSLAFRLSRKHREIARENLARAFPEMPADERERLARGVLSHFGLVMADFMRSGRRSQEETLATTTIEGREHLDAALARGKGVLLVGGHFGNFERMPSVMSALGYTVNLIARDANDPELNRVVEELRTSTGAKVFSRGDAALPTLRRLKANEIVALLPDQNAGDMFLPFFGVPCGTVTGPAVLSTRSGAPIIPFYCARVGEGQYRLWLEPALEPIPGFEPVEGFTRAVMLSLENAIRQYPGQYLWIHNRWKEAKRLGLAPPIAQPSAEGA